MIYFDNAATTLRKPDCVIKAVTEAMGSMGNSGRGVGTRAPGDQEPFAPTWAKCPAQEMYPSPSSLVIKNSGQRRAPSLRSHRRSQRHGLCGPNSRQEKVQRNCISWFLCTELSY